MVGPICPGAMNWDWCELYGNCMAGANDPGGIWDCCELGGHSMVGTNVPGGICEGAVSWNCCELCGGAGGTCEIDECDGGGA